MRQRKTGLTTRRLTTGQWLWIALILGTLARGVFLEQLWNSPLAGLHRADQTFYREWAKRISQGILTDGHIFEQGPLYAYLAGGLFAVAGVHDSLLTILQSTSGLAMIWLVWQISRMAFDETVATLAAILAGLYGPLIFFEGQVMKTFLAPLGTALFAYCLLRAMRTTDKSRNLWLASGGAVTGLLCLVRESYSLFAIPLLWIALMEGDSWRKRAAGSLSALLCMAAVTSPATLHNLAVSGEPVWITSGGGEVFYMGWGPDATGYYRPPSFIRADPIFEHEDFRLEASRRLHHPVTYRESSRFWAYEALATVGRNPAHACQLVLRKMLIAWNDFEVPDSEYFDVARNWIPLLLILPTFGWISGWGILGIGMAGFRDRSRLILSAILFMDFCSIVLTYNFSRFRISLVPLWIVMAAFALVTIVRKTGSTIPAERRTGAICLIAGALLCLASFLRPPGYGETGYSLMAESFQNSLIERKRQLQEIQKLKNEPVTASVALRLAQLYYSARLMDEAESQYRMILRNDPKQGDARMQLAVLLAERGDYQAAAKNLLTAIDQTPRDADLWANLGNTKFHEALRGTLSPEKRQEFLNAAKTAYEAGLKIQPGHSTCLAGLRGIEQSMK